MFATDNIPLNPPSQRGTFQAPPLDRGAGGDPTLKHVQKTCKYYCSSSILFQISYYLLVVIFGLLKEILLIVNCSLKRCSSLDYQRF